MTGGQLYTDRHLTAVEKLLLIKFGKVLHSVLWQEHAQVIHLNVEALDPLQALIVRAVLALSTENNNNEHKAGK